MFTSFSMNFSTINYFNLWNDHSECLPLIFIWIVEAVGNSMSTLKSIHLRFIIISEKWFVIKPKKYGLSKAKCTKDDLFLE
jgi:hypothetical protein